MFYCAINTTHITHTQYNLTQKQTLACVCWTSSSSIIFISVTLWCIQPRRSQRLPILVAIMLSTHSVVTADCLTLSLDVRAAAMYGALWAELYGQYGATSFWCQLLWGPCQSSGSWSSTSYSLNALFVYVFVLRQLCFCLWPAQLYKV